MRLLHFVGNTRHTDKPYEYIALTEGASLPRDFLRPGYHLSSDTEIEARAPEPFVPGWPLDLPLEKPMFTESLQL